MGTGTGSPGKWSQHQARESSRIICTMVSDARCDSWDGAVQGQELDLEDPEGSFQLRMFYDSVML